MKKRKVLKSTKSHKIHHSVRTISKTKLIWGLEPDFILIVGGGFLVIVLGMMLLK